MIITIHTPSNAKEAYTYIADMDRVFIKPNGLMHFYKADTCDHCDCKAKQGDSVDIGATALAASTAIQKLVKANNPELRKAKSEPVELFHNEETLLSVCEDCDRELTPNN